MDDFIYQIKLSQIENCSSDKELVAMFKELYEEHGDDALYGDCCVNFQQIYDDNYTRNYASILVSDLLGNIYNRLIDSKQAFTNDLKSVLYRPFPPIDKEQAIKNIKAFHGID